MVILNSSYSDFRRLYLEEYDFFNNHLQYQNALHYPVTRQIQIEDFLDYTAEYVILMIIRYCEDVYQRVLPREYLSYVHGDKSIVYRLNTEIMTVDEIDFFSTIMNTVSQDDWSPKIDGNVYIIKYDRRDLHGRGKTPARKFTRPNHQGYGQSKWQSTDFT